MNTADNSEILTVLLYTFIIITSTSSVTNTLVSRPPPDDGALYLTPLLDKGDIETARAQSEVKLDNFSSMLYSHAGYITVDKQLRNHLFFWHFPSQKNSQAPLLMWLNGGPMVSSMLGLFWSHGPLEVSRRIFNGSYVHRKHTWVGPFSVVYVDNPVGAGYSFTESGEDGYKVTQPGYTQDLYNFVLQFFKMFPEYKTREFYIAGQSYAGKYVPALAHRIHEQRHNECADVPLVGVILGAPFFDPATQTVAFFDFLYALGAISYSEMKTYKTKVNIMYQEFLQGDLSKYTFSELIENLLQSPVPRYVSLHNYITGLNTGYDEVLAVMTTEEMRKAVHVGINHFYRPINNLVRPFFGPDVFVSTKPQMAVIMDHYKVLIYNGDYDVMVSSAMIEAALMSTNWSLQEQYNNSHRTSWEACFQLKGYYSQTGQLCRVVVHGAGHQTPHDMPETSLEMVTDFLNHGCINVNKNSSKNCIQVQRGGVVSLEGRGSVCSHNSQSVTITTVFCMLLIYMFIK